MTGPFDVSLAASARRDLRSVPPRIVHAVIEFMYGDLACDPRRVGKPLKRELEGLWSARRGPYRVLYEIRDDLRVILVVHVEHRGDVYRPR